MNRAYYSDPISDFLATSPDLIISELVQNNAFSLQMTQRNAWNIAIAQLKNALLGLEGKIYLEYTIPRMGKRVDALLIIGSIIFVLEFKIGSVAYNAYASDQVWDYALDLQNFHSTSHDKRIVPILINKNKK